MLYKTREQVEKFHLHEPKKTNDAFCKPLEEIFKKFKCNESYILAEETKTFNCIGWAVGVKEFMDPVEHINQYYTNKHIIGNFTYNDQATGEQKINDLYKYERSLIDCMKSTMTFFYNHKNVSILSNKDQYIPVIKIPNPPKDGTIAFYFKSGKEFIEQGKPISKGFAHAARYFEEVSNWASYGWASKLGRNKLVTHGEYELTGDFYGDILCYLAPVENFLADDL